MSFTKAFDAVFKVVNNTFGVSATYTHIDDSSVDTIKGVFDNAFIEVQTGHIQTVSKQPIFKIREADLTTKPTEGDSLVINSVTYQVVECQPDAVGGTTLILEKA